MKHDVVLIAMTPGHREVYERWLERWGLEIAELPVLTADEDTPVYTIMQRR